MAGLAVERITQLMVRMLIPVHVDIMLILKIAPSTRTISPKAL